MMQPSSEKSKARPHTSSEQPKGAEGDWELFLLRLRYREGRLIQASANRAIALDDPDAVWVLFTGQVDLFATPVAGGEIAGARRHLGKIEQPTAFFGLGRPGGLGDQDDTGRAVRLSLSGASQTRVIRVRRSAFELLAANPEYAGLVAQLVERWIVILSAALTRGLPPRELEPLTPGLAVSLADGVTARCADRVTWVSSFGGSAEISGQERLTVQDGTGMLPLAPDGWLRAVGQMTVAVRDTGNALTRTGFWPDLGRFHDLALACLAEDDGERTASEQERSRKRAEVDRVRLDAVYADLTSILGGDAANVWAGMDAADPELSALRLVGRACGVTIQPPAGDRPADGPADGAADAHARLEAIARASQVRLRRVGLRGAWWTENSGPLLGFITEDHRPVALIPMSQNRYALLDPTNSQQTRVTARSAATLEPSGFMLHRRFERRALAGWDVLKFGLLGRRSDIWTVVLMMVFAGLLSLLAPMLSQLLFDQAIPGAQRSLLLQMGGGLIAAAVASLLFQISREIAVLRLSGRMDSSIQAAVIDRLVNLPAPFFRQYSAGDLAMRAMGVNSIRETLSRVALSSFMSGVSALTSFGLLLSYDVRLALIACGLAAVLGVAVTIGVRFQLSYQRVGAQLGGKLTGAVFQLVTGIVKLRVAGAEHRAFAYWAPMFGEQRRAAFGAGKAEIGLSTFNATYQIVCSLVIFSAVALLLDAKLSTSSFVAFNTAFGQFLGGALGIIGAFNSVAQVVPTFERVRPILAALPEGDPERVAPGELRGALDVDHLTFRYAENTPPVLDDVSIQIRPGEFVALVGPSGSGKSTLLRLLLGFEEPESGAILFDGRSLANLDVQAVRRQCGSVLQNGRLMVGDIQSNIIGSRGLTLEDAWEAARMAGFDGDIRDMPMGMSTVVSEGGGTLSGGQRQRLMIARALVSRPRILFFDEATSALDNRTQDIVSRSLERLAATRVVIAHRLSTIVNADRIYVLEQGRIVEAGTYRELMQRRGRFADLARRQLA